MVCESLGEPLEDCSSSFPHTHSTAEALGSAGGTDSEQSPLAFDDSSTLLNTPDSWPGFPTVQL